MADVHLGYQQYGLQERADDFAAAFFDAVRMAIEKRVDFVLIAGDLFHKRQVDALTLQQAMVGLNRLRAAGIPCVAVQGNHEIAHYQEAMSWVRFLAVQGALTLLHPSLGDDAVRLERYRGSDGGYVDVIPGVRIYGLHHVGAGAGPALRNYAAAISALPPESTEGVAYRIFLAHAGVQGVLTNDGGSPSLAEWRHLDGLIDYVALGHVHKPFDFEDRLYNPGSLETCGIDELAWEERGVLLVDVDTEAEPPHQVRRERVTRRPFLKLSLKVDGLASYAQVHGACLERADRAAERLVAGGGPPVVDLSLTGFLTFAPQELDLEELRSDLKNRLKALHVQVRNFAGDLLIGDSAANDEMSRDEIEKIVFGELFGADAAYAEQSDHWAQTTMEVKKLVLAGASPDDIAAEVQAAIAKANAVAAAPAD
jgi:DNA repair exonuclease SbcCD nuclease subunit